MHLDHCRPSVLPQRTLIVGVRLKGAQQGVALALSHRLPYASIFIHEAEELSIT
jgi:hypothetical protein